LRYEKCYPISGELLIVSQHASLKLTNWQSGNPLSYTR